jgi:hypothetical protein
MKVKVLRLFVVPLLLLLAPAVAQASVSLLIGEAVGGAGEFTGSGHAAVYFSAICAETPTQLRHCKPGEEGVVITSYPGLVAQTQYKWMAIPLTAFLYAVDSEDNKVLYGNGKIRKYLRTLVSGKHFSSGP